MTITEAFEQYIFESLKLGGKSAKTQQNCRTTLNSLMRCTPDTEVQFLTLEHVTRWKMYMHGMGNQPSSMSHCLGHLRNVLKFLASRGYNVLDADSIKLPLVKSKSIVFLDYGEVQLIIDEATNPRDKLIVALLFSTGCRISELLNLNRDDVVGDEIRVTGKGDKQRPVYIDSQAQKYLAEYLETRHDKLKPLFISGQYRRITVSRVEQIVHVLAGMAGIDKNVTLHTFRHSFATDLLLNGCDIRSVQVMLGHENLATTQIYTHVTDRHAKLSHQNYHSNA